MGGRGGQEHVSAIAQRLHTDALVLEVGDAVDAVTREQFEAADVETGDCDDRQPGLDRPRQGTKDKGDFEIDRSTRRRIDNAVSLILG